MKNKMGMGLLLGMLVTMTTMLRAEDSVVNDVKDGAHSAADQVDSSAHKAKRSIKHRARKTKTDIQNSGDDNAVRKAGRRVKDAGTDAGDKIDDTVHGH